MAIGCVFAFPGTVSADKISDLQDTQKEKQNELNSVRAQISELEDEQSIIDEELADVNAELIDLMTGISLLEDQIQETEAQIEIKVEELEAAKEAYSDAVERERSEYEAMKVRIRYMYERGDQSYLNIFMGAASFGDMLTRAEYIEQLYEYDRKLLTQYQETTKLVAQLRDQVDQEKQSLEETEASLQADKEELVVEQGELNTVKNRLKAESDAYESKIQEAEALANQYKQQIKAASSEIKRLQEEERKRLQAEAEAKAAAEAAARAAREAELKAQAGNQESEAEQEKKAETDEKRKAGSSVVQSSAGSELGKKIANYGCQFVGNPYVAGGTSLTNGADCSGFTWRIYADFGYSIPRNSTGQRSAGTAVGSLAEAQPGDIICYPGHVGLYIGSGLIVHASTERTGIKISNAQYRSISAIRRIIK